MIVLCGKSGSGKDTVAKELEKMGLKRVVTCTTRPKRDNEVDGETYHFIDNNMFLHMEKNNEFLETTSYNVSGGQIWRYGTPRSELESNKIVILNPSGVSIIKASADLNPVVFYLETEDRKRISRLIERRDNPLEMHRRLYADDYDFQDIDKLADYYVPNNVSSPKVVADYIYYIYFEKEKNNG